jgi:stage V sporulation protein SpoVS
MIIVVQVINAGAVECAGAPNQAVHLVALLQQLLGHVGAILTCDPGYECTAYLCHNTLRPIPDR